MVGIVSTFEMVLRQPTLSKPYLSLEYINLLYADAKSDN